MHQQSEPRIPGRTKRGKTEEDNQWRSQQHGGWGVSNNLHGKKDGVKPEFDIRTDRFEVAIEAIDKINQSAASQIAKSSGKTEAVKDFGTEVKTDPEKS